MSRSKIQSHNEYFTNGKFQFSYIECTSKKSNNQFLQNIMFNQIKCPTSCEINEHVNNSILLTSIIKIWNVPIISCFCYERLCFLKQLKYFSTTLSKQLFICFQIQIKPNSTSYICTSCSHNINKSKQAW
jgi:hypothetical protein